MYHKLFNNDAVIFRAQYYESKIPSQTRRETKWVRSLPMLMNPPHQEVALTKIRNSEVHCVAARGVFNDEVSQVAKAKLPILQCFCTILGALQTPCFTAFRALGTCSEAPRPDFASRRTKPTRRASKTLFRYRLFEAAWISTLGGTSLHQ